MQMSKVGFQAESSTLECLRDEFSGRRCVVAPTFLSPALARQAARDLESSEFNRATSDGLDGRRLATEMTIPGSNVWVHALDLLLNDQRLFDAIQYVTGCPQIKCFRGRISRHFPGTDHHSDWHDDIDTEKARLVGISINLSTAPYSGGQFLMRRKGETALMAEISHTAPGSAHIFAISDTFHHCVTGVDGQVPRTALAGWFQLTPDRWTVIRELYSPAKNSATSTTAPFNESAVTPSLDNVEVPESVVSQTVEDSVVILNMKTGKYYALNKIGAEVWKLFSQRCGFAMIVDQISDKYSIDKQAMIDELHALVSRLIQFNLLAVRT